MYALWIFSSFFAHVMPAYYPAPAYLFLTIVDQRCQASGKFLLLNDLFIDTFRIQALQTSKSTSTMAWGKEIAVHYKTDCLISKLWSFLYSKNSIIHLLFATACWLNKWRLTSLHQYLIWHVRHIFPVVYTTRRTKKQSTCNKHRAVPINFIQRVLPNAIKTDFFWKSWFFCGMYLCSGFQIYI